MACAVLAGMTACHNCAAHLDLLHVVPSIVPSGSDMQASSCSTELCHCVCSPYVVVSCMHVLLCKQCMSQKVANLFDIVHFCKKAEFHLDAYPDTYQGTSHGCCPTLHEEAV